MIPSVSRQNPLGAPWPSRLRGIVLSAVLVTLGAAGVSLAQSVSDDATKVADTLKAIEDRGAFLIGADIPYGVMEYFDEAGEPAGIDIEIARRIAASLDVTLSVKNMPFDQLFGSLAAGEIDAVVSAVTITQERQKSMLFSVPYMDAGMSIAVSEDNEDIESKDDIIGKRVGVLKGTVGEELMLKSKFIDPSLVISYESNERRIADLRSGEVDAIIVHFISSAVPNIKIIEPPLTHSFYGIAVRLQDDDLMVSINSVLRDLKRSGEIRRIMEKFVTSGGS